MISAAWVKQSVLHGERRARSVGASLLPRLAPAAARKVVERAGLVGTTSLQSLTPDLEFDGPHYRGQVAGGGLLRDPALHYLWVGRHRGLSPHSGFDAAAYRQSYPDVHVAGYDPFAHARHFGALERRIPVGAYATLEPAVPSLQQVLAMRPLADGVSAQTVNVIVPVYSGRDNMLRTIAAVLTARDPYPHSLVVIDDASPEVDTRDAMAGLAARGLIRLITQAKNGGFVRAVNAGLDLDPGRAVVLLNSDTAVFGPWLTRMMQVATGRADVATVTPLSNAATILSYPIWLRDTALWPDLPAADIDATAAALDLPPQDIPTGVGFCMAISAPARRLLGPFDADAFGQGYGEENDYCRRAAKAGLRNLAACNTFVWHQGGGTFGPEKRARVDTAQQTLERLHPGYRTLVHHYIRRDPLAEVRARIDLERLRRDPRKTVLCLDAEGASGDELPLRLVRDIGPYAGLWRLVPVGTAPCPNLPRLSPRSSPATLQDVLERAGVTRITAPVRALLPALS